LRPDINGNAPAERGVWAGQQILTQSPKVSDERSETFGDLQALSSILEQCRLSARNLIKAITVVTQQSQFGSDFSGILQDVLAALKRPNRPRIEVSNFLLQRALVITFDPLQRLNPAHTFTRHMPRPLDCILRVLLGR
jgi:hypothetical protein